MEKREKNRVSTGIDKATKSFRKSFRERTVSISKNKNVVASFVSSNKKATDFERKTINDLTVSAENLRRAYTDGLECTARKLEELSCSQDSMDNLHFQVQGDQEDCLHKSNEVEDQKSDIKFNKLLIKNQRCLIDDLMIAIEEAEAEPKQNK